MPKPPNINLCLKKVHYVRSIAYYDFGSIGPYEIAEFGLTNAFGEIG